MALRARAKAENVRNAVDLGKAGILDWMVLYCLNEELSGAALGIVEDTRWRGGGVFFLDWAWRYCVISEWSDD